MDLVITLIGTIALSCGNPTVAVPKPCETLPRPIEMYIPDGRFNERVCKADDTFDPVIRPHEAFIRIRGARARSVTGWPGAIQCSQGSPCVLYPLTNHRLTITEVTSGAGVTAMNNLNFFPDIRWSKLMPGLKPQPQNYLASMTIKNGKISYHTILNGMISARITVTGVSGDRIIRANGNPGPLQLVVPETAVIDIINLPRVIALADLSGTLPNHDDDCDHFFLHYLLAANPPVRNCDFPQDGNCPPQPSHPHLGATIACSNSTYP